MINTGRIIDFYEDVFGNEIDVYEQKAKYTVWYEGYLFEGDTNGYNEHDYDKWDAASELINAYGDLIHVRDNEYGVSFDNGEWN